MAAVSAPTPKLDRYIVIHVATTCDEHGVYVTKDSAEVIELGWILLDSKTCEEVHTQFPPQPLRPVRSDFCHFTHRSIYQLVHDGYMLVEMGEGKKKEEEKKRSSMDKAFKADIFSILIVAS